MIIPSPSGHYCLSCPHCVAHASGDLEGLIAALQLEPCWQDTVKLVVPEAHMISVLFVVVLVDVVATTVCPLAEAWHSVLSTSSFAEPHTHTGGCWYLLQYHNCVACAGWPS